MTARLRSAAWLDGDDEAALQHRAALSSMGLDVVPGRPVVGISDTVSDLNPCNSTMGDQIEACRQAVEEAGGTPVVFPTISLGEDLMKPTAMLYRNLLSIEIEEMVRAHPIDALVVTGNCDKTIPGALMGAISTDIPTLMMIGGARPLATFRGEALTAGTGLWDGYDAFRRGELDADGWAEFEACYSCGRGACNVMGTATTMAVVAEVLGFVPAGGATIPAGDPRGHDVAALTGRLAVERALDPIRPRDLVTMASLALAVAAVSAAGGSTNALIHVAAMAGRAGLRWDLDDTRAALRGVRAIVDVLPVGRGSAQDFERAGGVPALLHELDRHIDPELITMERRRTADISRNAFPASSTIGTPVGIPDVDAIAVVSGSLAPDGAVIKTAAGSSRLRRHRGPAVVFDGYDDMRRRIDSPDLDVTADSVLVLRGGGPVGGPGMPEWGMLPIPKKLALAGVSDMLRVSDARMSGTSFGTVVLHVAPEAHIGGPLAFVRDGDIIEFDVERGILDLDITPEEFARRRATWVAPTYADVRGWPALYRRHVLQAPDGCDLDFLRATSAGETFIEPIVGRS